MRKRYGRPSVEDTDDFGLIVQAFENVGRRVVVNVAQAMAQELKRLKRVQEKQEKARQLVKRKEWLAHEKATGQKHPDDDIPF